MTSSSKLAICGVLITLGSVIFLDRSAYSSFQLSDAMIIAAVAIVGGAAFWVYSRLAPDSQRKLQIFLKGAMACFLSASLISFVLVAWRALQTLQSFPGNSQPEPTLVIGLVAPTLFLAGSAVYYFCLFFRALQKRINKSV